MGPPFHARQPGLISVPAADELRRRDGSSIRGIHTSRRPRPCSGAGLTRPMGSMPAAVMNVPRRGGDVLPGGWRRTDRQTDRQTESTVPVPPRPLFCTESKKKLSVIVTVISVHNIISPASTILLLYQCVQQCSEQRPPKGRPVRSQRRNFLTEECTWCKNQIVLEQGDVTYDGKWYHATCWGRPEPESIPIRTASV